jgi:hypothetical protein
VRRTEPGQPAATRSDKYWTAFVAAESTFDAQFFDRFCQIGGKRNEALLPPFSAKKNLPWMIHTHIGGIYVDRLGNPGTGAC